MWREKIFVTYVPNRNTFVKGIDLPTLKIIFYYGLGEMRAVFYDCFKLDLNLISFN